MEDTNNLAYDKRLEIEDGISETLDENYNTPKNTSECHYNEVSDSEEEPSDKDSGDSEISEDKSETEAKYIEETEIFELTHLVLAWEMLAAKPPYVFMQSFSFHALATPVLRDCG